MIEIKNTGKKVVIETLNDKEPNKIVVKLNNKKGLVIPAKSTYELDTGLVINCSKLKEEVFVEANTFSEYGCFAEDMTINKNTDNKLILTIENFYDKDITIENGKKIAILYKYFVYNEAEDFDIIYNSGDIVVAETDREKEFKTENVEVTSLENGRRRFSMDIIPL